MLKVWTSGQCHRTLGDVKTKNEQSFTTLLTTLRPPPPHLVNLRPYCLHTRSLHYTTAHSIQQPRPDLLSSPSPTPSNVSSLVIHGPSWPRLPLTVLHRANRLPTCYALLTRPGIPSRHPIARLNLSNTCILALHRPPEPVFPVSINIAHGTSPTVSRHILRFHHRLRH